MSPQYPYYYGIPQRLPGPDGQILAQPAPGTGIYPPGGPLNPNTGMPFPTGTTGNIILPTQSVQDPPYIQPPLGTQTLDIVASNVVSAPSGGSAAAITAATQLSTSFTFNCSGASCPVLSPGGVGGTVALVSYNAISPGVFKSFGLHVYSAMGLRAIRAQVQINGTNFPGVSEVELSSFFEGGDPATIFVPFNKNDQISVLVRNLDLQSSYVVTARLSGWRYQG